MQINWDKITDNTAVWCKTIADAKAFLEAAEKRGVEWRAGDTLTSKTNWTYYKDRTCYNIASSNKLYFGKQSHYIDCGYTVIDYRDLAAKPRICEVLGVEVGEEFRIVDNKVGYNSVALIVTEEGAVVSTEATAKLAPAILAIHAINHPTCIIRKPRFTGEEIADMRVIRRILNVDFIDRNTYGNGLVARTESGNIKIVIASDLFPSLHPGQSVNIDEILAEAAATSIEPDDHTPTFGDLSEADRRELIVRWNIFSGNDCDNKIEDCHRPGAECHKCRLGKGDGDGFLTCSAYVRAYPHKALEILRGMECGNAKAE